MTVAGTASLAFQSLCSVFGIRAAYEQPPYEVMARLGGGIEVRRYGPRLGAEVEVANVEGGRNAAFDVLAGYIFGKNHSRATIAMTTPVAVTDREPHEVAMTTPVETATGDGMLTMRFFLPARYTLDSAPAPDDERVRLRLLPGEQIAALRFNGSAETATISAQTSRLLAALEQSAWRPTAEPSAYLYDPPFTLPFLRRNEVVVRVAAR
jgi:hypothetical protein